METKEAGDAERGGCDVGEMESSKESRGHSAETMISEGE